MPTQPDTQLNYRENVSTELVYQERNIGERIAQTLDQWSLKIIQYPPVLLVACNYACCFDIFSNVREDGSPRSSSRPVLPQGLKRRGKLSSRSE